jgi:hypothetical protein
MKLTYIDMLNGLRLGRAAQYQPSLTSFPIPNSNRISPPSFVRFLQSAPSTTGEMDSTKHNSTEPERQSPPESKTVDTMSSYGEGYATRSDEEGFGGIYGGNQYFNKDNEDKKVDGMYVCVSLKSGKKKSILVDLVYCVLICGLYSDI